MDNALQNLLELSRDPMLALKDGRIRMMNAAAVKAFPDRRVGDAASDLLPDLVLFDPAESFLTTVNIQGVRYTVSALRSDGLLCLSLAPEAPAAVLRGCLSDSLISGMLSTLFNIGLSADRLRAGADPDDQEAQKYFGALYHNYYALYRKLGNLNALCALSEGSMDLVLRHTDLVALCGDLVASAALLVETRCARIEFVTELESLPACVDTPKVERLLLNLLSNALAHTPRDGLVRLRLARSGDNALISLDDNGCGIPPAQLKNVFHSYLDRMDQTALSQMRGGGLGLALCSLIAEKHGGTLLLESREGEGTAVRLLLPLAPPASEGLESEAGPYTNGGMTVLLTELSELLESADYAQGFPD